MARLDRQRRQKRGCVQNANVTSGARLGEIPESRPTTRWPVESRGSVLPSAGRSPSPAALRAATSPRCAGRGVRPLRGRGRRHVPPRPYGPAVMNLVGSTPWPRIDRLSDASRAEGAGGGEGPELSVVGQVASAVARQRVRRANVGGTVRQERPATEKASRHVWACLSIV